MDSPLKSPYLKDEAFRDLDPDRELTAEERMQLISYYQHTGNLRKAARFLNVSLENAMKVLDEETEEDPRILTSPEPLKIMGIALRQIGIDLIESQRKLTEKHMARLSPKQRLASGVFALEHAHKLFEAWANAKGAKGVLHDPKAIEEEEKRLEEELARLQGGTDQTSTATAQASEAGSAPDATLGEDVDDTG